jgi:flavodoxin
MKTRNFKTTNLIYILIFSLTLFLSSTFHGSSIADETTVENTNSGLNDTRPCIVYFSRSGKTRMVVNALKGQLSCEVAEIKSEIDRTGFLGAMTCVIDQYLDREDEPEPFTKDLTGYNPILIGSPIWMGKISSPVRTFIKGAGLKGKDVYIFVTYSGRLSDEKVEKMKEWLLNQGLIVKGIYKIVSAKKGQSDFDKEVKKILEGLPAVLKVKRSS